MSDLTLVKTRDRVWALEWEGIGRSVMMVKCQAQRQLVK